MCARLYLRGIYWYGHTSAKHKVPTLGSRSGVFIGKGKGIYLFNGMMIGIYSFYKSIGYEMKLPGVSRPCMPC